MDVRGTHCHQLDKDSLYNSTTPRKGDIAGNLRDYREEICGAISSIDQELAGLLIQKGIVINESELESKPQKEGVEFVLERVETQGGEAFCDLLWCLDQTGKSNVGHRYAAAVLRNKYSLDMLSEIFTSMELQRRYQDFKVMRLTRGLCVQTLVPYLMKNKLITDDKEVEQLTQITQQKGALKLLRMLKQKGPLAHLYLTKALIEAKGKSPLHEEILEKVLP